STQFFLKLSVIAHLLPPCVIFVKSGAGNSKMKCLSIIILTCFNLFATAQSSFEKYYNERSDYFNKLPDEKQDSNEGLNILLEIETNYGKLSPGEKQKFSRRMGDTFLMTSGVYSIQQKLPESIAYLQKAAEARSGDLNIEFINSVKMFDNVRNEPGFKNILASLDKYKPAKPDISATPIPAKQLKKDLTILKQSLEEAHQGLYTYNTKAEINTLFKQAESKLDRALTPLEFYRIIDPLVVAVKDGHTRVSFPDQPASVKNHLPLSFIILENKLYLYKSLVPAYTNWVGKEVESISGQSAATLIKATETYFSSDGSNITNKHYQARNPYKFSCLLTTLLGRQEKFELVVKNESAPVNISGITVDSLKILRKAEPEKLPIEFTLLKDKSTAIITCRSFAGDAFERYNIDMRTFLTNAMKQVKDNNIQNLILDVRGNGGGQDVLGRMLFSCFVQNEFRYYQSLTVAKNNFKLFDYVEGGVKAMPANYATKNKQGTWDVSAESNGNVGIHKPFENGFTGQLYVLIDGGCFSTTSEMLSHLHAYTKAVFVGQESGGNYYTNNSGLVAGVTLPNSHVVVNVPMLKYVMAVPDKYSPKDRGIVPNHEVVPGIDDLVKGKDVVLEYVLGLVK
ncbi:MAG TPA: S41 family peptidase, partial [Flavobacteriales bacterium]|nr:S41 family peptidase [Flavobacteriales bacterium]